MVFTSTNKPFCFYRLSSRRTADELFEFNLDLPKIEHVFCDETFAYNKIYGHKAI
jgi:hypothetical protein